MKSRLKKSIVAKVSKRSSRSHQKKEPIGGRSASVSGDFPKLSDEQWIKISAAASLPRDGREKINRAIAWYHLRASSDRTSLKTKRTVGSARNFSQKLIAHLRFLDSDLTFKTAGLTSFIKDVGEKRDQSICETLHALDNLDKQLADAQERMRMKPGRKSIKPVMWFVQDLMAIEAESTKKAFSRSTKTGKSIHPTNAFVFLCAQAADPKLSKTRINAALIKCIARHHQGISGGYDTANKRYLTDY